MCRVDSAEMHMRKTVLTMSLPALLCFAACGDDTTGDSSTSDTESPTETGTATATETGTASGDGDGDDPATMTDTMSGDGDGDSGDGDGDTNGDGDGDTNGDGDGDTNGDGDGDSGDGDGDSGDGDGDSGDGDGDTGGDGDGEPVDPCMGMGPPQFDFSYLWVSNSPQGTVSKIDTLNGSEVARYASGPQGSTDPSRTSVSGNGKFAVVANRAGSLTMIAAEEDDCIDANNNNQIDTSTGPNDVLPWGEDECVIWNIDLPGTSNTGPRPVSWTIGEQNPQTCEYSAGDVWIGWYDQQGNSGEFRLVEGMTGNTLAEVSVPNWSAENWGPYGGAIDSENNFWVTGWGQNGPVVKIDGETNEATNYGNPGGWIYGMGLDLEGNTWSAGCGNGNVYRFDKEAEQASLVAQLNAGCLRGLQVDSNGVAWIAKNSPCGLAAIDTSVEPPVVIDGDIPLAGCGIPVGVSIDAEGFVWVVDQSAQSAFKVDPETYQIVDQVGGLVSPYTYSDMTGAGINAQINPQ